MDSRFGVVFSLSGEISSDVVAAIGDLVLMKHHTWHQRGEDYDSRRYPNPRIVHEYLLHIQMSISNRILKRDVIIGSRIDPWKPKQEL